MTPQEALALLKAAQNASNPQELEALANQFAKQSATPKSNLKPTNVKLENGRYSMSGARVCNLYAHQLFSELQAVPTALSLYALHESAPRTTKEVVVAKAWGDRDEKRENHTFVGAIDTQTARIADELPARFENACDSILKAAEWINSYRANKAAATTEEEVAVEVEEDTTLPPDIANFVQ